MFSKKGHSCGDCKLACVDCNSQICPKCMVVCPVGNRCPQCSGKFVSHVLKISGWAIARTLIASLLVGYGFGYLSSVYPGGGFYMLIALYFVGLVAGKVLHKISGHKLGPRVLTSVIGGIIFGYAVSPLGLRMLPVAPSVYRYFLAGAYQPDSAQITAAARQDWPDFINAFQQRQKEDLFTVKAPVVESGKATEHIWVVVKDINADELTCDVPRSLAAKFGAQVKVSASDIDDWEYQNAEGTSGGFSRGFSNQAQAPVPAPLCAYRWVSSLVALAIFCFGAATPLLGGSMLDFRNPFRMR